MRYRRLLLGLLAGLCLDAVRAAEPPAAGLQPEVTVAGPTRLDWRFAAGAFGPQAARLPESYESGRQRYLLFVPSGYDPKRLWPLIVFISPGDDPLGWRVWQKPCADSGALFCAAYGAGNNCPPAQRIRIVLDMFDDVRRHYRVDPDQTYLSGFSGGGRMACTIAFALPEYFGGVAPLCGTNPLNDLGYLRHRVRDRLSVALVTGAKDFNRGENEHYMLPLCRIQGIRTRVWVVPKLRHELPGPDVAAEVYGWLADDLKRRQEDRRAHPGLAVGPTEWPTPEQLGGHMVEAAEAELRQPARTWEGVTLLQGVVARFGTTRAAERARQLLEEVLTDPKRVAQVAEQGGAEERQLLLTEAEALERIDEPVRALRAWKLLLQHHPQTPAGEKAAAAVRRLSRTPYLGVGFAVEGATVDQVAPKGPAADAGLQAGDKVVQLDGTTVASVEEVRRVLQVHAPGDKVTVAVRRGEKSVTLTVKLGALPGAEERP